MFWEEGKNARLQKQNHLNSRKRNAREVPENMDAGNVEKETNSLENFVGIFYLNMLPNLKLVSFPCSLIVLTHQHWISIFISDSSIEIMDSMGYISDRKFSKYLQIFLSAHLLDKTLLLTPKIQSDDSNLCALYSVCFLYFRTLSCGNLCDFCRLFSNDFQENCHIISKLFINLKEINNKK